MTSRSATSDRDPAALLLLRHGQSTWNAQGRWQGDADSPLSTLGVRQARAAAAMLGTFDVVVASHLERARTTAEIVAGELGIGPVRIETGLAERCAGEWQGLTKVEIDERFPGYRAERRTPPGWESDDLVNDRASTALGAIAATAGAGATALVVTHGGLIRCLEELCGVTRTARLKNLAGRWFHVGPGHFRAGDAVELVVDDLAEAPGQV